MIRSREEIKKMDDVIH